jgi:hypothetical protein
MEFKYIEKESEYPNEKYLLRAYGNKKGNFIGTYDSIKKNCIETKEYCFVERKTDYYVLSWDLDFKEDLDECYKDNHEKITKYIIEKINESIDEIIINGDKDYVYAESTKGLGKHIYYIFIITDIKLHLKLYDIMIKKIEKEKKYNKEIVEKIIDRTVCVNNGIRLFGCVKDGGYYYPVKEKSTYKISGDIEKDFEYCLLNTETKKYNNGIKIELKDETKEEKKNRKIKKIR